MHTYIYIHQVAKPRGCRSHQSIIVCSILSSIVVETLIRYICIRRRQCISPAYRDTRFNFSPRFLPLRKSRSPRSRRIFNNPNRSIWLLGTLGIIHFLHRRPFRLADRKCPCTWSAVLSAIAVADLLSTWYLTGEPIWNTSHLRFRLGLSVAAESLGHGSRQMISQFTQRN